MILKQSISGLLVITLCSSHATPAFSRTIAAGNTANAKVGMPAAINTPATSLTTLPQNSPALNGGISFAPSNLPTLDMANPATLSLNVTGVAGKSAAVVPSNAAVIRQQAPAGSIASVMPAQPVVRRGRTANVQLSNAAAPNAAKKETVLGSAGELNAATKKSGFGRAALGLFNRFFDGFGKRQTLNGADEVKGKAAPARRGALGDVVFHALKDGSDIRTHLPRTVVVYDTFADKAPQATVSRLQTLINEGVHIVVISDRPERGEGSIDEILVSKLKPSKTNPIAVASYAGARISFKESSKWTVVNEAGAFQASDIDRLAEIAARASSAVKLKNTPSYTVSPKQGDALSVEFHLEGKDRTGKIVEARRRNFIVRFNRSLSASKSPYRAQENPNDPASIIINALAPRLALGRIDNALNERFKGEDLTGKGDETMVLLSARGNESFMRTITADPESVPGLFRNASVLDAADAGAQASLLGAVVEGSQQAPIDVSMSDMRQYLDFWRPVLGRSGKIAKSKNNTSAGRFGLFTWQVLHDLMTDFYVDTARAGTKYTNFGKFRDSLRMRWAGKSKDGKFQRYRGSKAGKTANSEYLRHAERFAENFWQREIGDFRTAQLDIRENLVTEGKVYTQVPLRSPFTGHTYNLGVSIDRVMKVDTSQGRELNATIYRFGKEAATDGDEAQARAVALAVLRGYGRKGVDLKWHQGSIEGPALARITVQIEYLKRARIFDFTPDELLQIEADGSISQGPKALELVNEIESAQADYKYVASKKKKSKVAPNPEWEGTEWDVRGEALSNVFAGYYPDAPTVDRLRPFMSEATALRPQPKSERRAQIEILDSKINWPSNAKTPDPIDEDGSQIEDDIEATPRVVFIEDIFNEPADDATVDRVQRLIDAGAHVVFMTARPHKGEDSADSVLLDRLKVGQANPVIVASNNGGRIALHSRAKASKPYIDDSRAFNDETLKTFDTVANTLSGDLDIEFEIEGTAFQYDIWIPQSVSAGDVASTRSKLIRGFNAAMKAEGLEYTIQKHPKNPRQLWVRSQPMRMSLDRIFQALDKRFAGEELLTRPETFLVIGDSKRSLKLSKAWPKLTTFRSAQNESEIFDYLGNILGDRKQKQVGVKLGEIRSYSEFWEPMLERRSGNFGSGGHQSARMTEEDRRYHGPLAMFTGSIFYKLMPELFENVWRGQARNTSRSHAMKRLEDMWRNPEKEGVFVSKRQAAVMSEPGWKTRSRGYLQRALTLFGEIYDRTFDHYTDAAQDIMHNMAALATDRQSLITLVFKSGGKIYKVFTRLPRLMKHDTVDGRVLSVIAYRTGKEPFEGDGGGIYAKTLAMAVLAGFAQPGNDGQWHDGWAQGPRISKLHIRLEYKQGARDLYFDPSDFFKILPNGSYRQGVVVKEIANLIERMRADEEFQEHFKAENEKATDEEIAEAKKKGKGTAKKPAVLQKGAKK